MTENDWRDKIDDYHTSIQAIVGFANFYLWDPSTRSDRVGVTVFQGRRLRTRAKEVGEGIAKQESDETSGADPTTETVVAVDLGEVSAEVDAEIPVNEMEQLSEAMSQGVAPTLEVASADSVLAVAEQRSEAKFVTPDLGIVSMEGTGVLAEVKISFPKDEEHWHDDFAQLMSYDADLEGWPTPNGRVVQHDVVLITEQGRASKVKKFFEKHVGEKVQFTRPFVIVSCNRSDNRQQYYFFQRVVGKLTAGEVDQQLEDGTKVSMKVMIDKYSTVKIYDAEPPLPYMIELIWSQVVLDSARSSAKFPKLRKRQKVPVVLDVDDIVAQLREGFTFRSLDAHASEGTPAMPHRSWVLNAIEKLIALREAEWIDGTRMSVRVFFQMYEDALDHFVKGCLSDDGAQSTKIETQLPLQFPEE